MPLGPEDIRHRFGYHPAAPNSSAAAKHEQVREASIAFAEFLDQVLPDGRAKSLAITNLQQASMWANFAIAETSPVAPPRNQRT